MQGEIRLGRQLLALLAYLLLHRNSNQSRELLAGLFWGDQDESRAHSCLTTALWRLRRALEPSDATPADFIHSTAGSVGIDPAASYWLDVESFESVANAALSRPVESVSEASMTNLEEALGLYRGDLLEGFFDDWALGPREHFRLVYHDCLAHLMRYYEHRRDWHRSLVTAEHLLENDPIREDIHREVMMLYMITGQRSRALRQYEICRRILKRELGVTPMEETKALHGRLLDNEAFDDTNVAGPSRQSLPVPSPDVPLLKQRLRSAMNELRALVDLLDSYTAEPSDHKRR